LDEPGRGLKAAEIALSNFEVPLHNEGKVQEHTCLAKHIHKEHQGKDIDRLIYFEGIVRQSSDIRPAGCAGQIRVPQAAETHKLSCNRAQVQGAFRSAAESRGGHFKLLSKEL